MSLALGTRLDPYQVTAKIGEGGMGEVHGTCVSFVVKQPSQEEHVLEPARLRPMRIRTADRGAGAVNASVARETRKGGHRCLSLR